MQATSSGDTPSVLPSPQVPMQELKQQQQQQQQQP